MTGLSLDDSAQFATGAYGWEVNAGTGMLYLRPVVVEAESVAQIDRLQKLVATAVYLET
eukprot:EC785151.1.p2 GENE.EC785151.1~~EC785151.1.p2  ORF type:complete len:59 (+),score=19.28 EC785151.1:213-389(+)